MVDAVEPKRDTSVLNAGEYVSQFHRLAFPSHGSQEKRIVAVLFAGYFDEAAKRDSEPGAFAVAGFIADAANWEAFSVEWERALRKFDLWDDPGYFHMADFDNPNAAPYKDWPPELKHERLNHLLSLISKYHFMSVGCVVPETSFNRIMSTDSKALCGGPYGLGAMVCFRQLTQIMEPIGDIWIDYVFEDGMKGKGAVLTVYDRRDVASRANADRLQIESLAFRPKRRAYLPLQAADILAHELVKEYNSAAVTPRLRPIRYPLNQMQADPHRWTYLQDARLRELDAELSSPTVISPRRPRRPSGPAV